MNKRFLNILTCLFLSIACVAQNSNYIEVTVTDTVLITPDQFLYRLSFSPDMSTIAIDTVAAKQPNYYLKRAEEIREKQKQLKEEWQKKITAAGFIIVPPGLNEALIKNNYDNNSFVQIFINSVDSLIQFYSLIKNEKSLIGILQSAKTKNEEAYLNTLYKKLLQKAKTRASYIAGSIGKKVIGISSISENRSFFSTWSPYSQNNIFPSPPPSSGDKTLITTYQAQGNLTVKFSIK